MTPGDGSLVSNLDVETRDVVASEEIQGGLFDEGDPADEEVILVGETHGGAASSSAARSPPAGVARHAVAETDLAEGIRQSELLVAQQASLKTRLAEILLKDNEMEDKVAEDGNCFFHCLVKYGLVASAATARDDVARHLQTHWDSLFDPGDTSKSEQIERTKRDGVAVEAPAVAAAADSLAAFGDYFLGAAGLPADIRGDVCDSLTPLSLFVLLSPSLSLFLSLSLSLSLYLARAPRGTLVRRRIWECTLQ